MTLPIATSYAPMEAKLVGSLPSGEQWQYEPKFDGFRCLAFKDQGKIELRSKSGQPFNRYFPEVVAALEALRVQTFVLDGELVVPDGDVLSFDQLLMRIHPAHSRVIKLAREHPCWFIVFDLLVDEQGRSLAEVPLSERRYALERFLERHVNEPLVRLAPQTTVRSDAEQWLNSLGSGLDGVMAKRRDLPYQSGERTGMQKFKRMRSADCVIGGFRYGAKNERWVGSMLLGLYDDAGLLNHVGFTANIKAEDKPELTDKLEKLVQSPGFTGSKPGGPSRWSTERSGEWQPLATQLVIEVQYDHFSGGRFRHGTRFLRWRPDKAPQQCTMEQVEQPMHDATHYAKLLVAKTGSTHDV